MDLTKANAQLLKVREQLTATYAEIQEAKDATFEETKKAKLCVQCQTLYLIKESTPIIT